MSEVTKGYWWCSECRCEATPRFVTNSEHHEPCGHPVTWIEPTEVSEIERLRAFLVEISLGKGRFSMDHHEHACNTIEDMKQLAIDALAGKAAP